MGFKKHKQYRLPEYDYSSQGNYFITICTKNMEEYFGKIVSGKIELSPIGNIVENTWNQIPKTFPNTILNTYQVMPDHFHAIIAINNNYCRHLIHHMLINQTDIQNNQTFKSGFKNNPMESKSITLGKIIRWFKGYVKHEASKINECFHWQSRYYDRIIRNEKEYYAIRNYIIHNPQKLFEKIHSKF
jgi:putative transposase